MGEPNDVRNVGLTHLWIVSHPHLFVPHVINPLHHHLFDLEFVNLIIQQPKSFYQTHQLNQVKEPTYPW